MTNLFIPIKTADLIWKNGKLSSREFHNTYFLNARLEESRHLFIEGNQLISRWQVLSNPFFIIGEIGFGSGLNFLLTWSLWLKYAPPHATLHFISCEKFPFTRQDLERVSQLWPTLKEQSTELLNNYPVLTPGFHHLQFEKGRVNLTLMLGDAASCFNQLLVCVDVDLEKKLRSFFIDAWFLEGFSPSSSPEMWSEELFYSMRLLSKETTTLTAFWTENSVKKRLEAAGFKIKESLQKPEMIVGNISPSPLSTLKLKSRVTPWYYAQTKPMKKKKAIILGAGLAGCYTAYALAQRGWSVCLIDKEEAVGCGASGNQQAILYPKLSAHASPLAEFMLTAFLYAHRQYDQLIKQEPNLGHLSGILQLYSSDKDQAQTPLMHWLKHYPQLASFLDKEQASDMAGIVLEKEGLFVPYSGWINMPLLCEFLVNTSGIERVFNKLVEKIIFKNGVWNVGGYSAEILVLANGFSANQFLETQYIPLKSIEGQLTYVKSTSDSSRLKIPVCENGHVLPNNQGIHRVGATYHMENNKIENDDTINLIRLSQLVPSISWSSEIVGKWGGARAVTNDYLPLVGPVPCEQGFKSRYAQLAKDPNRWLSDGIDAYYPGLFLCAGFGSRGLTSIPLCAEWLASLINDEPLLIPRTIIKSLSPARFLYKEIIRNK